MNENQKLTDKPIQNIIVIVVLLSLWMFVIPAIIGLVLLYQYCNELKSFNSEKEKIENDKKEIENTLNRFNEDRFLELKQKIIHAENEYENKSAEFSSKLEKQNEKIKKSAFLFKSIREYIEAFADCEITRKEQREIESFIESIDLKDYLNPTSEIKLHNTDLKDLRKQYREINRNIDSVLASYEQRYTTKTNLSIYRLMVLGLRAELQNVLYTMKFGKLEDAENAIIDIAEKYVKIASDGNQQIAPTIVKFVAQMNSLFIDAVRVEYEYYVRKERIKEEQKALREQMRQEAEERKRLEAERKKIEAEESKYETEMEKVRLQISEADSEKAEQLRKRIEELEALMAKVNEKKETITKLQNGKAGCVYIISNLGSFGDHVFKVGMTRRFVPQERIDELGDASVPFSFDVHSFIFSEDASALETEMHHRLNEKRVNKVNLRKEFFDVSIDEIEALVHQIQPTAEFNRTMAAEQYRQSLSIGSVFEMTDDDEDIDEDIEE
jgi:hypothetical protein